MTVAVVRSADEPQAPAQAAPRYKAGDPAEFETQRKALVAEKAKAERISQLVNLPAFKKKQVG